jgi:hypothetical protein
MNLSTNVETTEFTFDSKFFFLQARWVLPRPGLRLDEKSAQMWGANSVESVGVTGQDEVKIKTSSDSTLSASIVTTSSTSVNHSLIVRIEWKLRTSVIKQLGIRKDLNGTCTATPKLLRAVVVCFRWHLPNGTSTFGDFRDHVHPLIAGKLIEKKKRVDVSDDGWAIERPGCTRTDFYLQLLRRIYSMPK